MNATERRFTVAKIGKKAGLFLEEWTVYVNAAPEGEKLVATFYGPRSQRRAKEYARSLNAKAS